MTQLTTAELKPGMLVKDLPVAMGNSTRAGEPPLGPVVVANVRVVGGWIGGGSPIWAVDVVDSKGNVFRNNGWYSESDCWSVIEP